MRTFVCLLALAGELCPLILPSVRKVNDLVVNFSSTSEHWPEKGRRVSKYLNLLGKSCAPLSLLFGSTAIWRTTINDFPFFFFPLPEGSGRAEGLNQTELGPNQNTPPPPSWATDVSESACSLWLLPLRCRMKCFRHWVVPTAMRLQDTCCHSDKQPVVRPHILYIVDGTRFGIEVWKSVHDWQCLTGTLCCLIDAERLWLYSLFHSTIVPEWRIEMPKGPFAYTELFAWNWQ